MNALYKKHDINDPEFIYLQTKAKNAMTWAIIAILVPVFGVIILIIKVFAFG